MKLTWVEHEQLPGFQYPVTIGRIDEDHSVQITHAPDAQGRAAIRARIVTNNGAVCGHEKGPFACVSLAKEYIETFLCGSPGQ